jgi:hypothetical protein
MSLPLGGSQKLIPASNALGGLMPVNVSTPHATYLPTSAGDGNEKSDQYLSATSPDSADNNALNAQSAVKQNGAPLRTGGLSNWHKPNLDEDLPDPLRTQVLELDDSLTRERDSFVQMAEKRVGLQKIPQTVTHDYELQRKAMISNPLARPEKQTPEESKSFENPDEPLPSLNQIAHNPNVRREQSLEKTILKNDLPVPYLSSSNLNTDEHHGRLFTLLTGEKSASS